MRNIRSILVFLTLSGACITPVDECVSGVGTGGILLSVRDSATSADLVGVSTVTVAQLYAPFDVRSGKVTDPATPLNVAAGRPGRYRVTISAPDYAVWSKEVEVTTSGRCNVVDYANVIALLQPSGQP